MKDRIQVGFRCTPGLRQRMRDAAGKHGVPLNEWMQGAVIAALHEQAKAEKKKESLIRRIIGWLAAGSRGDAA